MACGVCVDVCVWMCVHRLTSLSRQLNSPTTLQHLIWLTPGPVDWGRMGISILNHTYRALVHSQWITQLHCHSFLNPYTPSLSYTTTGHHQGTPT